MQSRWRMLARGCKEGIYIASTLLTTRDRAQCSRPRPSSGMLGHELEDQVRNLVRFFVQREMRGVEQADLRTR